MRTSWLSLCGVLVLATLTGCTTKSVEVPALAGPSTFARSLVIKAEKDTLVQNGQDTTRITVTALGPTGQSEAMSLRAQILVDNIPQDFGTLSSKNFVTPATIIYTAPPASVTGAQPSHRVTIGFTPQDSGDFRGEFMRTIDLQVIPAGVILPSNPALVPSFVVTPPTPQAFNVALFDASGTTNAGSACLEACLYAWNFGDGTSGTGRSTTHTFRTVGNFQVSLTVTDSRGAQATTVQTLVVAPSPVPTAAFTFTPTTPGVNSDVFFNGSGSFGDRNTGRTIVRYDWNFADGSTGSGATVTHRFSAAGTYNVVLTVTDDVGVTDEQSNPVAVASGNPTATMTVTPTSPHIGQPTVFNASGSTSTAGSTIVSYSFNYGDGGPAEVTTNPVQTHTYTGGPPQPGAPPQVVTAILTVTDSVGRTGTFTVPITIQNP